MRPPPKLGFQLPVGAGPQWIGDLERWRVWLPDFLASANLLALPPLSVNKFNGARKPTHGRDLSLPSAAGLCHRAGSVCAGTGFLTYCIWRRERDSNPIQSPLRISRLLMQKTILSPPIPANPIAVTEAVTSNPSSLTSNRTDGPPQISLPSPFDRYETVANVRYPEI
jgi:hypothetical protein